MTSLSEELRALAGKVDCANDLYASDSLDEVVSALTALADRLEGSVLLSKEETIEAAKAAYGCASMYDDKALETHNAGHTDLSKEWSDQAERRRELAVRLRDLAKGKQDPSPTPQEGDAL